MPFHLGIHSPEEGVEREPTPEPVPEFGIYNEITQEEVEEMQKQLEEEEKKEKPLCPHPLIATLTETVIKVNMIILQYSYFTQKPTSNGS